MHLMTEVGEAEVGGVQRGTQVSFEIESLGPEQFSGTIADVRLQPMQVSTSGTAMPATATAATSGSQPGRPSNAGPTSPSPTSPSATGASPTSATPAPASSVGTIPAQQPTPAAGQVISYTAIIDVENPGNRIPPGSTAIVMLPTAQRAATLRVPNRALAFSPSPALLYATGQDHITLPRRAAREDPTKGPEATVWKYEQGVFVPITIRVGIADERWTEVVAGPLQAGESLVTEASVVR
jgi:multidrug efflux pump subunit AcrA (membrane-fusion protein)